MALKYIFIKLLGAVALTVFGFYSIVNFTRIAKPDALKENVLLLVVNMSSTLMRFFNALVKSACLMVGLL